MLMAKGLLMLRRVLAANENNPRPRDWLVFRQMKRVTSSVSSRSKQNKTKLYSAYLRLLDGNTKHAMERGNYSSSKYSNHATYAPSKLICLVLTVPYRTHA